MIGYVMQERNGPTHQDGSYTILSGDTGKRVHLAPAFTQSRISRGKIEDQFSSAHPPLLAGSFLASIREFALGYL